MERYVKQLEYCTYCPKMCRHSCPVANALGIETFIPQAKVEVLNMLRRRAIPWEQEYILPLYACTSCRLCQRFCEHDNDVAEMLREGRIHASKMGLIHPSLGRLPEQFRERNKRLQQKLRQEFFIGSVF